MKRGRSMHAKRAMPLSLRVASIYAMLVAATLLVAAGLALQFTRNQVSGQVDSQLNALAKSFNANVPPLVKQNVATATVSDALYNASTVWLSTASFSDNEGAVIVIRDAPKALKPLGSFDLGDELQPVLPALLGAPTAKWLDLKGRTGVGVRVLRVPIFDPNNN